MSNSKTKKWEVTKVSDYTVEINNGEIDIWKNEDFSKLSTTVALVVKAPVMFDMLKKVLKENHCTPDLDREIEQLIAEINKLSK